MSGQFQGRVLVLGAGSVSQCTLPLLLDNLVEGKQVTIVDPIDNRERLKSALERGVTYIQGEVTRENLAEMLSKFLSAGDLLINLAWNIDANAIIGWAHDSGVMSTADPAVNVQSANANVRQGANVLISCPLRL